MLFNFFFFESSFFFQGFFFFSIAFGTISIINLELFLMGIWMKRAKDDNDGGWIRNGS
jgi:hypothetical protein